MKPAITLSPNDVKRLGALSRKLTEFVANVHAIGNGVAAPRATKARAKAKKKAPAKPARSLAGVAAAD